MDIAIIGIGIHPFGRFDDRSGLDMGVVAARQALSDAGVAWDDVEFAVGGSLSSSMGSGASPDTMVSRLGLSGVPFVNVSNGCATAGTALATACTSITAGVHDIGLVVGFDKHPRGAFDPDPAILGLGKWYGDTGMMLTTQFFAMKIQRYMHDFGISRETLAHRCEGISQRGPQPERVAPQAVERRGDPRVARCSTIRSRSTCSARRARAAPPWWCVAPTRPVNTRSIRCS